MAFRWQEHYTVNTDPFVHTQPTFSDTLGQVFVGETLVRTLLWWDVRYYVDEDHTQVPRAPVPWKYQMFTTPLAVEPPPPGDRSDSIVTGLLTAYPSEAYGTKDPTAELVKRLWVGTSGPNPIESEGRRKADEATQAFELRLYFEPLHFVNEPTGAFARFPLTWMFLVRTLIEFPDAPAQ